ncbi:MAG: hypothetical protein ACREQN_05615 [Candidatus Binataceae bacterium]
MENSAANLTGAASEKVEKVARDYGARARDYANSGLELATNVSTNLSDFVRREPWIAMVAAFAVGYVLARALKRVSP